MKSKTIYSYAVADVTKKNIPTEIIEAMHKKGWNEFGIYEVVKDALKEEKRKNKAKV